MSNLSFWDTNLLIYWLEKSDAWSGSVTRLREWHRDNRLQVVTSALSLAEILVHPLARGRRDLAQQYRGLVEELGCLTFGPAEAWAFAEIRAAHPHLKPPDTIQLACAGQRGVAHFFTNDDRLSRLRIDGIGRVWGLAEWADDYG